MDKIHIQKKLARMRVWVDRVLYHDICRIYQPPAQIGSVAGIPTFSAAVAREYLGSNLIPCWFDSSRAFRPEELAQQTTVADEYRIQFPHDVVIDQDDVIVHVVNGVELDRFKIRKLVNVSALDASRYVLAERVSAQ